MFNEGIDVLVHTKKNVGWTNDDKVEQYQIMGRGYNGASFGNVLLAHKEWVTVVLANSQPSNLQFVLEKDLKRDTIKNAAEGAGSTTVTQEFAKTVKVHKDRKISLYLEGGRGVALQIMVGSFAATIATLLF